MLTLPDGFPRMVKTAWDRELNQGEEGDGASRFVNANGTGVDHVQRQTRTASA
ncbi:MAG TPA: hypothetical protein VG222_13460 [Vicinamibacterales bacterium]|jgi:hypothetical protein|nr:hypothetical protein [Vicinamibacterales bacterium]